jgi:hypothetical protein
MRYAPCLLLPLTLLAAPHAEERSPTVEVRDGGETLFDPDPQHPWNRLHRFLYARVTQDGKVYDQESLEPLLTPQSRFLTEGKSHDLAVALLDEFLRERADQRVKDPVRRAVLQRDLWAVFAVLVGDARHTYHIDGESGRITALDRFEDPGDHDLRPEQRVRRRAVQRRLVQVMRRIALTPEEIDALPDNFGLAVRSGAFATAFDPKQPERAFLPPDLLSADGSWIAVSNFTRSNEEFLAAPQHTCFVKGRSVFVVYLRLPQCRKATEDFIKRAHGKELPQFPEGTQTALLRRTVLIDSTGRLRVAPLVESLQLRVYFKMDSGLPVAWKLSRRDLFAGRNGGLRAVTRDHVSYFDFQTRTVDIFESPKPVEGTRLLSTCGSCHDRVHGIGGVHTMNTAYSGAGSAPPLTGLATADPAHEAYMTLDWTRKSYTWGLLQGMWDVDDLR